MNKCFPGYSIIHKPFYSIFLGLSLIFFVPSFGQRKPVSKSVASKATSKRTIYGLASFYHNKFNGRQTSSGEIFSQSKHTLACNMLPLGTWVKITNIKNGRTVVAKVNDRLHPRMRRIADLSKSAAQKLGYLKWGITRIKVEVLGKVKPR